MRHASGSFIRSMTRAAGLLAGGVLVLATVGCGETAVDPLTDHIVFESNRDAGNGPGHQDLYLIRPDGSGLVRLTDTDEDEADPAMSPDGRHIAYTLRPVGGDVHIMNADGSGDRRLTDYAGSDFRAAWSPDGKHLVFASERSGRDELFVIDRNGDNRRRLTIRPRTNDRPSSGAFSPDGDRVVFESWNRAHEFAAIFTIPLAGGEATRLPIDLPITRAPAWSPDGTRIAFVGSQSRVTGHGLYVLTLETGDLKRLTGLSFAATAPAWSPDSKRLAFENFQRGSNGLFRINADGTGLTEISADDGRSPHWGPASP